MTAKHLTGSAFTEGHFSSSLDRRSSTSDGVPFRRRGRRSTAPHVENNNIFNNLGGTRWRTCLRRCATGRMAADSVCDGVPATFQLLNPSARTMAARPSQRLTKISTRDVSWVGGGGGCQGGRCIKLTKPSCAECLEILVASILLNSLGTIQTCNGIAVAFSMLKGEVNPRTGPEGIEV